MELAPSTLSGLYNRAHDVMRNVDGMQPQEAFDELLKYLFWKEASDKTLAGSAQIGFRESSVEIRQQLRTFGKGLSAQALLHEATFKLSDTALSAVHRLFHDVNLSSVQFDMRSAALREFMRPDLRRGLGIFLTPDDVVRSMVEIAAPLDTDRVCDTSCGSGTFLIEVLKFWRSAGKKRRRPFEVWGADKSARMLLLAELNLGNLEDVIFHRQLMDSLAPPQIEPWSSYNYFDVILTNPPFGVSVDSSAPNFESFGTCRDRGGAARSRQEAEVVFIEQCLRFLKPGGRLGIVLPRSVLTNVPFADARAAIDKLAYVTSIVSLPPETFQIGGTQTTTAAVFFQKYARGEKVSGSHQIASANITNVGYDSTGRSRCGEQLTSLASDLAKVRATGKACGEWQLLKATDKCATLSSLSDLLTAREYKPSLTPKRRLGDYLETACLGRTPGRSEYTNDGLFLVKVGNLTGQGIDWIARDRNFVTQKHRGGLLQRHDLVLTSSAHSPVYIAKKVDIVTTIPDFVGGKASFVGEVMLLRVDPKHDPALDPWMLLAYLRSTSARGIIQKTVHGKTAHLHPDDIKELLVPEEIFSATAAMKKLREILQEEAQLSEKLNLLVFEQAKLIRQRFDTN
jgi:type I restriction enzyme M protein